MKSIFKVFIALLLVCSCKKELEPQPSSGTVTPAVTENTAVPAQQTITPPPANMQQPVATTQPAVNIQPGQPVKTAPGMNPPHGQPNHRCDIKVGEPLNSPPGKTADPQMKKVSTFNPATQSSSGSGVTTTVTPSNPTLTTSQSPAVSTPAILDPGKAAAVTAPGMNPPHGQDGHRCDVAVGAPLPK